MTLKANVTLSIAPKLRKLKRLRQNQERNVRSEAEGAFTSGELKDRACAP